MKDRGVERGVERGAEGEVEELVLNRDHSGGEGAEGEEGADGEGDVLSSGSLEERGGDAGRRMR